MVNLYELLGLPIDATENQIRQYIMQHHAAGTLDDKVLGAAKKWLLNADIRKQYDAKLLAEIGQNNNDVKIHAVTKNEPQRINSRSEARREFLNNKRIENNNSNKKLYILLVVIIAFFGICYAGYSYNETKKKEAIAATEEQARLERVAKEEAKKRKEEERKNDAIDKTKYAFSNYLRDAETAKYKSVLFKIDKNGEVYSACGFINAKNGFGAYTGYEAFIIEPMPIKVNDAIVGGLVMTKEKYEYAFDDEYKSKCENTNKDEDSFYVREFD